MRLDTDGDVAAMTAAQVRLDPPQAPYSEAGDRWTWLVLAARTQLRLAREAAADRRRPAEKPAGPVRLTLARVRWGSGTSARTCTALGACRQTRLGESAIEVLSC